MVSRLLIQAIFVSVPIPGSTRPVSDEGEDHIDHPAVTGQREMDAGNALDQLVLPI